jgi:hypothetical protein
LLFFVAVSRIFVFLLTRAAEKLLISENRSISGFQDDVGGIGGSGVQSENRKFSANGIPSKYYYSSLNWSLPTPQRGHT